MALPTVSGRGFLLSEGVELQFAKSGTAWARLPLVFSKSKKVDDGWETEKEIRIDGVVFGPLAEFLADNMTGRGDMYVTGELYTETWVDKEGATRTSVKLNVTAAAPAPSPQRNGAARSPRRDADANIPF